MRKSSMMRTFAAMVAAVLLLAGCSNSPDAAADGAQWDETWTLLGTVMGVGEPGHGLALTENPVSLMSGDNHYAVWSAGEEHHFTNDAGEEAVYYDAQLYAVASGFRNEAGALNAAGEWLAREREIYEITGEETVEANNQSYTVLTYRTKSETNPYSAGAVAIGVYKRYAVSLELTCLDAFPEEPGEVLKGILAVVHYSAEI